MLLAFIKILYKNWVSMLINSFYIFFKYKIHQKFKTCVMSSPIENPEHRLFFLYEVIRIDDRLNNTYSFVREMIFPHLRKCNWLCFVSKLLECAVWKMNALNFYLFLGHCNSGCVVFMNGQWFVQNGEWQTK